MFKSHFENQEPTVSLDLCHVIWFNLRSTTQQSTQGTGQMVKQVRQPLSWVTCGLGMDSLCTPPQHWENQSFP